MELTVTAESSDGGVNRLKLAGAVDLVSRERLLTVASQSLSQAETGLVLNLADVNFIDSTGIGVLIELSRLAEDGGKHFAIEQPSVRVQRVLTLTGLNDAWTAPPPAAL